MNWSSIQPVLTWDNTGQAPESWESEVVIAWRDFEPQPGMWRFDLVENALASKCRRCHLLLLIHSVEKGGQVVDYTPNLYRKTHVLEVDGRTAEMPNYGDPTWKQHYRDAITALANRFRSDERVATTWLAVGLSNETQCMTTIRGVDFRPAAAKVLAADDYYSFIVETTDHAVRAWYPKPVILPGAPSPGGVWGQRRRDVVQEALGQGAGYMMNGLLPDNPNAVGLGKLAGLGLYDMARHAGMVAFEGGKEAGSSDELYWMLLHALNWWAEFVSLQRSWLPHWDEAVARLPAYGDWWIVFRDKEHDERWYGEQGFSGDPGCWGFGIRHESGGRLEFDEKDMGCMRHRLVADEPVTLAVTGMVDGTYKAEIWTESESTITALQVQNGKVTLPAGPRYHRVDLFPWTAQPKLEDRVAELESAVEDLQQYSSELQQCLLKLSGIARSAEALLQVASQMSREAP